MQQFTFQFGHYQHVQKLMCPGQCLLLTAIREYSRARLKDWGR